MSIFIRINIVVKKQILFGKVESTKEIDLVEFISESDFEKMSKCPALKFIETGFTTSVHNDESVKVR